MMNGSEGKEAEIEQNSQENDLRRHGGAAGSSGQGAGETLNSSAEASQDEPSPFLGSGGTSEIQGLHLKLEESNAKIAETHDRMLRIAAEFENSRKRWEKEREDIRKYAISEFARELLPVIDAFDKAMTLIENAELKSDTEEGKTLSSIVEGVQIVSKVFHDSIKKHGIERVPGRGEAFNPEFHNAIARAVDASLSADTVVEEFVSGYKIGDRVLRTAMVKVATPD